MKQFGLECGGTCSANHMETMEDAVEGYRGCEPAINNHRHYFPHHLHQAYKVAVSSPIRYHDHRLTSVLLCQPPLTKFCLYKAHHLLPVFQFRHFRLRCLPLCSCCHCLVPHIPFCIRPSVLQISVRLCLLLRRRLRLIRLLWPSLEMI